MVAWWKELEEKRSNMTSLDKKLEAIDRFENNVLLAIKKFERRVLRMQRRM